DPTSAQPTFTADLAGMYVVTLTVNDGFVDSAPSNVTVVALTVQDALTDTLEDALDVVNGLDEESFEKSKRRKKLAKKINVVLDKIEKGKYTQAYDTLVHDILPKTDGCAWGGAPDADDWITDCEAQDALYPLLLDAMLLLELLI
ncbi:MAG: hypothetical protein HKN62_14005, partial [Phycisphaerales bacterium]|nr:hypothetical protein [Phycisphaerales bacterium]